MPTQSFVCVCAGGIKSGVGATAAGVGAMELDEGELEGAGWGADDDLDLAGGSGGGENDLAGGAEGLGGEQGYCFLCSTCL